MALEREFADRKISKVTKFAILALVIWSFSIIFSICITYRIDHKGYVDHAVGNARGAFNKDLVYRRWVSSIGGVYAIEQNGVKPNPYLAEEENRDLVTTDGQKLTMVNPAYMTRLVHEMGADQYGVKGHITSLTPLRPENKADEWETNALKIFEEGDKTEIYEVVKTDDDKRELKYMKAVIAEPACLKCHAKQGYKVGDIRGGISVYVPMERFFPIFITSNLWLIIMHILLWVGGSGSLIYGAVSLNRSNAKRTSAEKELRHNRDNLEKLVEVRTELLKQKNNDFVNFIYSVAHDMKSPLVTIDGLVDIVKEDYSNEISEEGLHYFTKIKTASGNLRTRVDKLLNYSRLDAIPNSYSERNFMNMANEAIHNTEGMFTQKSISPVVLESSDVDVSVDHERLIQLLENLLSNAVKYIGKDNTEPRVEIGTESRNGETVFFVRDNGIGIAPEDSDRAFELCRRLYKGADIEGSGIGLATAKRIVNNHGGKIWIESDGPGTGCALCFTLGVKEDSANS